MLYFRADRKWNCGASVWIFGFLMLQAHTQNTFYFLIFCFNIICTKYPKYYVLRSLTVLFFVNCGQLFSQLVLSSILLILLFRSLPIHTLPKVGKIYIREFPALVGYFTRRNWVALYTCSTLFGSTRNPSRNWNPKTLGPYGPLHDRLAVSVKAQQYSSTDFFSLGFHPRKDKRGAFKNALSSLDFLF